MGFWKRDDSARARTDIDTIDLQRATGGGTSARRAFRLARKLHYEPLEQRHLMSASSGVDTLPAAVGTSAAGASAPAALQAYPLLTYSSQSTSGTATSNSVSSPPPSPVLPYLNDTETKAPPAPAPGAPPIQDGLFPRLNMTLGAVDNTEEASAYDTVAYNGSRVDTAAQLKAQYPDTVVLRYYLDTGIQASHANDGSQMPFNSTGPITNGTGQMFAGDWEYLAGTTATAPISATQLTIGVNNAARFTAGQYVVIYDGPAGSFANAEHDLVQSVNQAAGTITLASRGYKSAAHAHPAGAIIAQHALVPGSTTTAAPTDWAFNMSSTCPLDPNGRQMNTIEADWISSHLNLNAAGKPVGNFKFDGLRLDGDIGYFQTNPNFDTNNDLTADSGIDATGKNVYGTGMQNFYAQLRTDLGPAAILVGGNGNVRGFSSLNGDEGQGYPTIDTGFDSPADYSLFDQKLALYSYHTHDGSVGPQYNEILNKNPTLLYPTLQTGGTPPTSNAPFRESFGFALLQNGSYGQYRGNSDAWWDEYSVDVVPGSPTYGKAIPNNPQNEANVRAHEGWLGNPLGPVERLYNPSTFAATNSIVRNGTFDTSISGWTANNVTISRDTSAADVDKGQASLHVSPQLQYSPSISGAAVNSAQFKLQAGVQYTVSFAARSSALREIGVAVSTTEQNVLVSTNWQTHVLTFSVPTTGSYSLSFLLGRESSDVGIDEVYVFQGDADVFQRDFENGTVFVNATGSPQTIKLSSTYQRINGTQDPINNGAVVSGSITIPAYDAAILIRQGASSVAPHAPGNLTATPQSSTSVRLHWEDLSSNEASFAILRRAGTSGTFQQVGTVGGGVTSFTDSGLNANTQYFYEVLAVNSIGKSAPSNVVSVKGGVSTTASTALATGMVAPSRPVSSAVSPTATSSVSASSAAPANTPSQPTAPSLAAVSDNDPLRLRTRR